jgi:hypothetical protein
LHSKELDRAGRHCLRGGDQRAVGEGHGDRVHPGINGGDAIEVRLDHLTT